jgi:hypothetical protein
MTDRITEIQNLLNAERRRRQLAIRERRVLKPLADGEIVELIDLAMEAIVVLVNERTVAAPPEPIA